MTLWRRETISARGPRLRSSAGTYLSSWANMERWQSPKSSPQIFTFLSAEPVAMSVLSCSTQVESRRVDFGRLFTVFSGNQLGFRDLIRLINRTSVIKTEGKSKPMVQKHLKYNHNKFQLLELRTLERR